MCQTCITTFLLSFWRLYRGCTKVETVRVGAGLISSFQSLILDTLCLKLPLVFGFETQSLSRLAANSLFRSTSELWSSSLHFAQGWDHRYALGPLYVALAIRPRGFFVSAMHSTNALTSPATAFVFLDAHAMLYWLQSLVASAGPP